MAAYPGSTGVLLLVSMAKEMVARSTEKDRHKESLCYLGEELGTGYGYLAYDYSRYATYCTP